MTIGNQIAIAIESKLKRSLNYFEEYKKIIELKEEKYKEIKLNKDAQKQKILLCEQKLFESLSKERCKEAISLVREGLSQLKEMLESFDNEFPYYHRSLIFKNEIEPILVPIITKLNKYRDFWEKS